MRNPSEKAVWGAVLALPIWLPVPASAGPRHATKLDKALQEDNIVWGTVDEDNNIVWGTSQNPASAVKLAGGSL